MPSIYLDSAATTQVRDKVVDAMHQALKVTYGNPSSTHSYGRSAKTVIEQARKTIAARLGAKASEIIFTSGGTEADNMILRCAIRDAGVQTLITSKIEHHAVLHTCQDLAQEYGVALHYVDVDNNGEVDYEHLETLLQTNTTKKLVSLMHVNNEIGTLLNVEKVGQLCRAYDAFFHSDTIQSVGHFEWNLQETPIDFLTAAAHKFHGPKGIGFAYLRKNTGLKALIVGGQQERGYRAGTESYHNIVGLEKAFTLAYDNLAQETQYIQDLKNYFIIQLQKALPGVAFNGASAISNKSTYTLVNVRLPFNTDKSALLLFHLDLKGIACSKGSACQSGTDKGSHVLQEILSEEELQKASIRFSFSTYNTKQELDYVVQVLKDYAAN